MFYIIIQKLIKLIHTYGNKSKLSKINERKGNSLYLLHPITHHHHHSLLQHVLFNMIWCIYPSIPFSMTINFMETHMHMLTHTHIHAHMHTSLSSFFCFLLFVLKNWDYTIYTTLQLTACINDIFPGKYTDITNSKIISLIFFPKEKAESNVFELPS